MIDERQIKMIELLVSGEYKITEIAKLVGVSRQAIYEWLKKEEVKAEIDRRLTQIRTNAAKQFDAKLDIAIDEYWKLAMTTTDVRTKQIALSYWIDRSLGKTTNRLDIDDKRDIKTTNQEDILNDIESLKQNINIVPFDKGENTDKEEKAN